MTDSPESQKASLETSSKKETALKNQQPFSFSRVVGFSLSVVMLLSACVYCWSVVTSDPLPAAGNRRSNGQKGRLAPIHPRDLPFALEPTSLPADTKELRHGVVRADGIPSITKPRLLLSEQHHLIKDYERVIGVVIEGEPRAYPLKVLSRHECVNDILGNQPIAVTYCPLCDSCAVFDRQVGKRTIELGVSGSLYNSNVLFYDRVAKKKGSLWSQMFGMGVSGSEIKTRLKLLPLELTTWKSWKSRYPKTEAIAGMEPDGSFGVYNIPAYEQYFETQKLMFPVKPTDARLQPKTPVLGIRVGKLARAYPIENFAQVTKQITLNEKLGGKKFTLLYEPSSKSLRVIDGGEEVEQIYAFWFAWYAFYPETELYSGKQ